MRMDWEPAKQPERTGEYERVGPEVLRQVEWPAWQQVRIFVEKAKVPKSGKGKMHMVGFEIEGGPANGYCVFVNFNVHHENPAVQKRAREEHGEMMLACGAQKGADTRVLLNRKCRMFCEYEEYQGRPGLKGSAWRPLGNEPEAAPAGSTAAPAGSRPDPTEVKDDDLDGDVPF